MTSLRTRFLGPLLATLLALGLVVLGCTALPQRDSTLRSASVSPLGSGTAPSVDPSIARLDPDLLAAVRAAARAAERDGVRLVITSGWRSRAHQERLLAEAMETYGSEEEARRWVASPDSSRHVTGDAVDIGPTEAADWVGRHGAAYGLCQVFANERWHFELLTAPGGTCPAMLPDGSSPR